MDPTELITSLGERLGIELALDENDACAFTADDLTIAINHIPELESFVITCQLGEPPPQNLEALYKMALEANHLFAATAGATISLNHDTGAFVLCRALPLASLNPESLYSAIERFVNTGDSWHKLIANFRDNVAPANPESSTEPPAFSGLNFMQV